MKKTVIEFENKLVENSKHNPKMLYAYINNQRKCHDKIRSLVDHNNQVLTDEVEIANCLNEQFYSSFSELNHNHIFPEFKSRTDQK